MTLSPPPTPTPSKKLTKKAFSTKYISPGLIIELFFDQVLYITCVISLWCESVYSSIWCCRSFSVLSCLMSLKTHSVQVGDWLENKSWFDPSHTPFKIPFQNTLLVSVSVKRSSHWCNWLSRIVSDTKLAWLSVERLVHIEWQQR